MPNLARTALAIDADLLAAFDDWMSEHGYRNRSEAFRDLARQALAEARAEDPDAKIVAVLSIVYDHAERRLAQEVTHLQHGEHHVVLCSQHVHLDSHNCLETIAMQGPSAQVRALADSIVATKGVKAGRLTVLNADL